MIERHYHAGTHALLKSYDFNFSFCIPNSTNEWEAIYDLPSSDIHTTSSREAAVAAHRSTPGSDE